MKIIKLDVTTSTNDYLKNLSISGNISDFTIITANHQTKGRGQIGQKWDSQKDKNLLCSIYTRLNIATKHQFHLNFAVSVAVLKTLDYYKKNIFSIKWPNDIMASDRKISGVLIENTLTKNTITSSIIGIGVNINQVVFDKQSSKATSLANIIGEETNLDEFLLKLISNIKKEIELLQKGELEEIKKKYMANLYKYGIDSYFSDSSSDKFIGKITDINSDGKLVLETVIGKVVYGIKEIVFL
ncbi:MAG: biotin--[acetyl-CoA-carboxylase] ligase [Flavobacteriaceae bacterium]|nr:biotin--[acetyl-CoA-carboxylase] ligase [Flavobacteriaceae bacterium]